MRRRDLTRLLHEFGWHEFEVTRKDRAIRLPDGVEGMLRVLERVLLPRFWHERPRG